MRDVSPSSSEAPRMRLRRLIARSLSFHARAWSSVALAAAITAAIVTGALLVGDSVRGSLRDRALDRLVDTEFALVAPDLFPEDLANRLAERAKIAVAPVLFRRGSVSHATTRRRANDVQIIGIDERFLAGLPEAESWSVEGRSFVVPRSLADELGASPGDSLILSFETPSAIDREQALGDRRAPTARLRGELALVAPDRGAALLDLRFEQSTPRNVFVSRAQLARIMDRAATANALLVRPGPGLERASSSATLSSLTEDLGKVIRLDDLGLHVRKDEAHGHLSLESDGFLLPGHVVTAAHEAASVVGAESLEVLTYLATGIGIRTTDGEARSIPYSTVTAIGAWHSSSGETAAVFPDAPALGPGKVLFNEWAAGDLEARIGDQVSLTYFEVGPRHELHEAELSLELVGVVPLSGAAADPGWTPPYPGVSDARTFGDWDPPFPLDTSRIRDPGPDGDYWAEHRTTPKAFLSIEDGRRIWASRFGELTSVRVRSPLGASPLDPLAERFGAELLSRLDPARFGLAFRAVREEALVASSSGTDFGGLFIAMSFFVIVSALALAAMAFRLAVERRVRELGLLVAVGFATARVRRLVLAEASVVALVGASLGLLAGLGYASLLLLGLKTLWVEAVRAPFLELHITTRALIGGGVITVALILATVFLVLRRLLAISPRGLLVGQLSSDAASARRRPLVSAALAVLALVGAIVSLALSSVGSLHVATGFFLQGTLLLLGGLAGLRWWLARPSSGRVTLARGSIGLIRLGLSGMRRARGRSLLTAALIALATFTIVTVAASRRQPERDVPDRASGNGGFTLVARSSSPLFVPLDTEAGQRELGLGQSTIRHLTCNEGDEHVESTRVFALRERPGDETSCLNLYRPRVPRILGVPSELVARGGFRFSGSLAESDEERANPWRLLEAERFREDPDVVPAIGDENTVLWILHAGLGDDILVTDDRGRETRLRIVALASRSLLQGSLAIPDDRFLERFDASGGWSTFFIETPASITEDLATDLEADLGDYGFDVRRAGEILAEFQAVENTYLSTFFVLGGLGLLLGTLGLGAALARNVLERRGETALLRALGYSARHLRILFLSETIGLLLLGEAIGAISAIVATGPGLASGVAPDLVVQLPLVLVAVFLAGVVASLVALTFTLRGGIVTALRRD